MLRRFLSSEKVRFLIIGGFNTVLGFSLFALFNSLLGRDLYLASFLLSYGVSLIVGYALYRCFVFGGRGPIFREFLRYVAVTGASFLFNLLALPLLVEGIKLSPLLSQAIVLVFTVVGSYVGHRSFSFRQKTSTDDSDLHGH